MSTRRERRKEKSISRHNPKPTAAPGAGTGEKVTAEEIRQEKSFFVWTGVITLVVVLLLYFVMTR